MTPNDYSRVKGGSANIISRIPTFPEFKHLDLEDHEEIDLLTREYPPYSEFNFVNLFCYDTMGDCQVSILNGNLVVRFRDYVTREPFCSFLGCNRVADTVERLMALSREQGVSPFLQLIPECCIRGAVDDLDGGLVISEDPDSADYIIDAASLVALTSGRWRNKRKAASKFKRSHPNHALEQMDIHDAHTQEQIRRLFHTWAEKRHKTAPETQNEMNAIERVLRHSQHFRLISLGAFLNGRLEGFTINEVVHDRHYVGHFGKTNPDYSGLAVVLESETARIMVSLGCKYMNYQQDLGLDGLKRHKRSWHPTAYLRKFTLHLATDRPIRKAVLK
jgi:hypothetical protein